MRILIIDNNIDPECWGSPELRRLKSFATKTTFYTRRGPHRDLPSDPAAFDKIIISGSRTSATETGDWIEDHDRFLKRAIESGRPILGVCYGHQSIARVMGGVESVNRSKTPEFGWIEIENKMESPITKGLPKRFYSFAWHYDEVNRVPEGFQQIAASKSCRYQAYASADRPIFGVQFHPEKSLEEASKSLKSIEAKSDKRPFLENVDKGKTLYDPKVGETIFRNFLEL